MILYYAPHTCALASHIALEQAGADHEAKLRWQRALGNESSAASRIAST